MTARVHSPGLSRLLSGVAILTIAALPQSSFAETLDRSGTIVIAQAPPADNNPADNKKPAAPAPQPPKPPTPPQQPQARPAPPPPPPPRVQQQQPPQQQPPQRAPQPPQQAQQPRPAPQTAQPPQDQRRQERIQERIQQRANEQRPGQPPQQPQQPSPSTAQPQNNPPPAVQDRRFQRGQPPQQPQTPSTVQQPQSNPSTAQQPPGSTPPAGQDRRFQPGQPPQQPQTPATVQQPQTAPSTAQQPPGSTPPAPQDRRFQRGPVQPPQAPAAQQPVPQAPAAQQPAQQAPAAIQGNPATLAPTAQPRDAREFMRRDGQGPTRRIEDVRRDRQETREGNRVFIREGDRTIIRENNTTIIQHNETNRFTINASNVRTQQLGGNTETIVQRGGGYSIINVTDANGRLVRRMRRDERGREVVIIDNGFAGAAAASLFVQLAAPVIRIPRERYIVDMRRSRPDHVYGVFMEEPVEPLYERYTLDQVRFSAPLRDRMPRVDLDVTFDTGSWQLTPDQIDKLSVIAEGINRALQRNPREVFMVEGYTDATGNAEDNLSLSDRRAESVAVALTEQFNVPPENLVTQGYGDQYLKIDTPGPEEANRRVAVRRITPLIDGPQANAR